MSKRIYVGNLPFSANQKAIESLFRRIGKVASIELDRGSAIVVMADDDSARKAIQALHQSEMGGRTLDVKMARPRTE